MKTGDEIVRAPVVAGMFYPGSAEELKRNVENYLINAPDISIKLKKLYGIIAPHAGYVYSGCVAAVGYKLLHKYPSPNVVVIAPSHREYFKGVSVYSGGAFETPLGKVLVSDEICDAITERGGAIERSMAGHEEEHSLEVQLPFLQTIFPDGFNLIPVVIGANRISMIHEFAQALKKVAEKYEFVLVASSDLSHYYPYNVAVRKDENLIALLEEYKMEELEEGYEDQSLEACGLGPILALMKYAQQSGNPVCKQLEYKNSGDTSGTKNQVVGYVSAVVYDK